MKHVYQSIRSMPLGDCFRACVASLIEWPLESVPNFNESGENWYSHFSDWCVEHGVYPLEINVSDWTAPLRDLEWTTGYWIASGPTAWGTLHAVVYKGGDLVHDPLGGGRGLERVDSMCVLVPLDIAASFRVINGLHHCGAALPEAGPEEEAGHD